MKKLLIVAASIFAASLLPTNSFALDAGAAKGVHAGESAVTVHSYHHRRHYRNGRRLTLSHYALCHYPYPNSAVNGCYTLWPF
jgi:hypothetical protein